MSDTQIAVSQKAVDDRNWKLGQTVSGRFALDNATEDFEIGAIYDSPELLGNYFVPKAAWDAHNAQPFDIITMIKLKPGVSIEEGKVAVQKVADRYFAPDVQDRDEYIKSVAGQIDAFLVVVYVLLALAIIIALMGIANTLSLSVYERIRELGLLRAVGQTRSQMRSMVRWESVIIAVFGTVGGVLVGLFLGWGILAVTANAQDIPGAVHRAHRPDHRGAHRGRHRRDARRLAPRAPRRQARHPRRHRARLTEVRAAVERLDGCWSRPRDSCRTVISLAVTRRSTRGMTWCRRERRRAARPGRTA